MIKDEGVAGFCGPLVGLGGPMFEPGRGKLWTSGHGKDGAHYNIFGVTDHQDGDAAWEALSALFAPDWEADEFNLCLFSTSGVHGMYTTLEEIEASIEKYGDREWGDEEDVPDDYHGTDLTFLVIHPRIVCLRYGNVRVTKDRAPLLRRLRESSRREFSKIGGGA